MRRPCADREEKRVTHECGNLPCSALRNAVKAMPKCYRPEGDHALSNAERQARYPVRLAWPPIPLLTHAASPISGAVPSDVGMRWQSCLHSRTSMPAGLRHSSEAYATAPPPRPSRQSPTSTWTHWPTSRPQRLRPRLTIQRLPRGNRLTQTTPVKQDSQRPRPLRV